MAVQPFEAAVVTGKQYQLQKHPSSLSSSAEPIAAVAAAEQSTAATVTSVVSFGAAASESFAVPLSVAAAPLLATVVRG